MADKDNNSSSEHTVSGPNSRREGRVDKLEGTVHYLVNIMARFVTAVNTMHNLKNVHQTAKDGDRMAENQAIVNEERDETARPRDGERRGNLDRPRRRLLRAKGSRGSTRTGSKRISVFNRLGGNTDDDADSI